MTREAGREARYRSIAADIAAKIRAGEYAPGEALPTQRALSASYDVTLMTLRQALRQLSDEGLIVQQPGRGTFVAPHPLAYQLGPLRSLADDLKEQGHQVHTTVLGRSVRRVPAEVAGQLRVRPGESALRLERLRAFAGRPAIHQVSWIRPPYGEAIRDQDFAGVSLYTALAETGILVAHAAETIQPALLTAAIARHLGEPEGSPVFVSHRVSHTLDGTAVVVDRATILGSMMEIRTDRAATSLSLQWEATS